ncbi:MAG: YggS family pyridoxal phosphate-dependent enzyme [Actinomycetota bacterium]|nr:YggS family pyridoxal phosphate-dependent enzyme [Actinomycetota bacterium]
MDYGHRVEELKEKVAQACLKAGREPQEVTIIAATKYAEAESIQEIIDCGIINLGENRAQDLVEKASLVKKDAVWHFIGHLQSRKAKIVVPLVEYIHSIDKISTLEKVNLEAGKNNKVQKVLIEVNVSGEESKYGAEPGQLEELFGEAIKLSHVEVRGFMAMAPLSRDIDYIRDIFRELRVLRDNYSRKFSQLALTELSMGMSNDYTIAIEEGATMIRVGSVLFK